jgi:ABC-type transport system substrate-binding protein
MGINRWYGPQNSFTGFDDPDFNAALARLRKAPDVETSKEALKDLQEIWNEQVPSVIYTATPWTRIWSEKVHGLKFNALGGMYFSDAYIES